MAKRPPPKTGPIFDAFIEVLGFDVAKILDDERGLINRAIKQVCPEPKVMTLDGIDQIAAEVRRRGAAYKVKYPTAAVTAKAITGNWSQFEPLRKPSTIVNELIRAWWFANPEVLNKPVELNEYEVAMVWLRIEGNKLWNAAWKDSPKLRHEAEMIRDRAGIHCDLRPEFIKPHVKAALDKLQAKEAE